MKKLLLGSVLAALMVPAVHAETATTSSFVLPPLHYISFVDSDSFYDKLKGSAVLSKLDKENYGTPIRLVVTYRMENTAGGSAAGFTSAILAGGSLGILPVVTNNDFVLSYELRVQDQVITSREYRENFTEATNMYSNKGLYNLDGEALEWAISTTDQFVNDIADDAELAELVEEYDYYFAE
ncbi:hypothetical protein [Shewanella maritima]|uniref:hypothetical protein n=1 Tax=Shewanella maritima TaxID=2520507 RepID=UPI003736A6EF